MTAGPPSGGDGLGNRAARGAMLLSVRAAVVMVVGFVRVALVARVLGPDELGIFTLVVSVVEASRALTTLGPAAVLIQRETIDETYVETYWVFKIVQSALTGLLVIAAYPAVAAAQPGSAVLLLHVLVGAAVALTGWGSPGDMVMTRDARFSRVAGFEMVMALLDAVVVVSLTLWLESVIALGIGSLVRAVFEMALSYRFFPIRVAFRAHPGPRREYLHAGGHFLILAVGTYVTLYGERALIGFLFGAHALGLYAAAYRLAEIPLSVLMGIAKRLLFPVLSRLRSDPGALASAVPDAILLQIAVLAPCAFGAAVFAEPVTLWSFGEEYADAVPVLRALALLTLSRGVANISGTMLQSAGRFDLVSRYKWLGVIIFVPGVLGGMWLGGLVGAGLGAGIGYASIALVSTWAAWRELGLRSASMARPFAAPLLCAAAASLPGAGLAGLGGWIAGIVAFVAVYVGLLAGIERRLTALLLERARRALGRRAPELPHRVPSKM